MTIGPMIICKPIELILRVQWGQGGSLRVPRGPRGALGVLWDQDSRGMSGGWFDESSNDSQGIYACIQVIQIFSWPPEVV